MYVSICPKLNLLSSNQCLFGPSLPPEYVDAAGELVLSMPQAERSAILSKYKTKTRAPLNSQFTEGQSRAEEVENYQKRKQKETPAYPSGKVIACMTLSPCN